MASAVRWLRYVALLAMTVLPAQANVFSDDPRTLHDPRHKQSQVGADKIFAPIGLLSTNRRVPYQYGPRTRQYFNIGTAFLVSPCYVLTDYHVVFGNEFIPPEPGRDYSATFRLGKKKSRAVPVKNGAYYKSGGGDWVLLRLEPEAGQPCLGEEPDVGWTRLTPLSREEAERTALSIAGYPGDRDGKFLWRQDLCHLYEKDSDPLMQGVWTTDCATQPRASGSPIFAIGKGALHVVAMMQGHRGDEKPNEVLQWNPNRANLALDVGEIVAADPEVPKLIEADIARFREARRAPAHPSAARNRRASP